MLARQDDRFQAVAAAIGRACAAVFLERFKGCAFASFGERLILAMPAFSYTKQFCKAANNRLVEIALFFSGTTASALDPFINRRPHLLRLNRIPSREPQHQHN